MDSLERKVRGAMIEAHRSPIVTVVAASAPQISQISIRRSAVRIVMAVGAALSFQMEYLSCPRGIRSEAGNSLGHQIGRRHLRMAAQTGDLAMGNLQGKPRVSVILETEGAGAKGSNIVALSTGTPLFSIQELARMFVGMTTRAVVEIGHTERSTLMATRAAQGPVSAPKGISGEIMVEPSLINLAPIFRRMADRAVAIETSSVGILVTISASGWGTAVANPGFSTVTTHRSMAFTARNLNVGTVQRKLVTGMVKANGRFPAHFAVTGCTGFRFKLTTVGILVAGGTISTESEISTVEIFADFSQGFLVNQVARPMAGSAVLSSMSPQQWVAGRFVIECLNSRLAPPDQVELPTMVINMAGFTGLIFGLGMESGTGTDTFGQKAMAGKTEFSRNSFALLVTLKTVPAGINRRMNLAQFPRR